MNIFKKNTEKHTTKLPMTGKVRKGFRIYCTAIMGAALILGTSVTAFAAGDPITVINNLSSFSQGRREIHQDRAGGLHSCDKKDEKVFENTLKFGLLIQSK